MCKKNVNHFSEIWNAKMHNRYFTKWDNDYWIDQLRNVTTYVCIPIVGPMQQDVLCFKWNSRRNARDIVESYRKTRAKRNCSQLLIINGPGAD